MSHTLQPRKRSKAARQYKIDRNWRYHQSLEKCQLFGERIGSASRTDGVWVYYLLDGMHWRFRAGRAVGPIPPDPRMHWGRPAVSDHVKAIYRDVIKREASTDTKSCFPPLPPTTPPKGRT